MPSPKPKPVELKILEGNPGKRKLPEPIKPNKDSVTCPAHLSYSAKLEWNRIVPELKVLGLLTNIDRSALAAYCQAYGRWVEAEKVLKEKGPLHKTEKGNIITSPMLWVANKALEQMHKFMVEFGMTPSSRTRISAKSSESDDPLDKLLSTRKN